MTLALTYVGCEGVLVRSSVNGGEAWVARPRIEPEAWLAGERDRPQ